MKESAVRTMVFYVDIFFAINFFADFVLLFCAGRLGGARLHLLRMVLGAAFGAFYACACVLWPLLGRWPTRLLAMLLLSAVTFGIRHPRAFFRQTLLTYTMAALLGGLAYRLFSAGGPWTTAFLAALSLTIVVVMLISGKLQKVRASEVLTLTVYRQGRSYRLPALLDSGNTCIDPVSGLPVILCEDVFPEEKCRWGSYHTASGAGAMKLLAPDEVSIVIEGMCYRGRDVMLGAVKEKLSQDGSVQALIGGMCFEQLEKQNKTMDSAPFRLWRRILHRGSGAAAATPDPAGGSDASFKACGR